MPKKKRSSKSKGSASSKGSTSKASQKPKGKQPPQKQIESRKQKKTPVQKESAQKKSPKTSSSSTRSQSTKPKARNFRKTYVFKEFRDKFKKTADKKFWKKIEKYWESEYDKRGRPATVVKAGINKKFVRTIKNRFSETKKPYKGFGAWKKTKEGVWKQGKPVKRFFWRDKLRGDLLRGKRVGARMRKVIEPDLIRGYMRKHGLKNYQKARKRFLKDVKNKSMRNVIWLYGASP